MKTMLELLIRLHELRDCCERARRNPQLSKGEKAVPCVHKRLVRECLPAEVLAHYDRMKKTERVLRSCPEVFAMAVLVAAFRSLSPRGRKKLAAHFATAASPDRKTVLRHKTTRGSRNSPHRSLAAIRTRIGEPRPRFDQLG